MTIGELRAHLSAYPDDMEVFLEDDTLHRRREMHFYVRFSGSVRHIDVVDVETRTVDFHYEVSVPILVLAPDGRF